MGENEIDVKLDKKKLKDLNLNMLNDISSFFENVKARDYEMAKIDHIYIGKDEFDYLVSKNIQFNNFFISEDLKEKLKDNDLKPKLRKV